MELYVLDDSLRRVGMIDQYMSLIWTERYSAYGDFELDLVSTRNTRDLLSIGKRLVINKSYRVMVIETVENKVASDGTATLKASGRSLESVLEDRVAMPLIQSLTLLPKWIITGTPGDIARTIFQTICVDATLNSGDTIPFYTPGSIFPAGGIPEPTIPVTVSLDIDTVYNTIKKICDFYNLGFRLVRNFDTSQLYFDVYTGSDRTTLQTLLPAVVFSPELDTLTNTSELKSTMVYKNVAYVFSANGALIVYGDNIDPTISGFDRRVLMVNATDITTIEGSDLTDQLTQRGLEELAKQRIVNAFDGEIPKSSSYVYGVSYNLGDLIQIRNTDGVSTNMRVTEQIFVSDTTGEKSYPTLAIDTLIEAGTWSSWSASYVWDDAIGVWADA
jgi:hypothetical protein